MTKQQSGREAFEAWATSESLDVLALNIHGDYRSDFTHAAWQGWQAALAQQGREAFEAWASGVLNRETTIKVLTEHNAWRRGAIGPQTDPTLLGKALDAVLAALTGKTEVDRG